MEVFPSEVLWSRKRYKERPSADVIDQTRDRLNHWPFPGLQGQRSGMLGKEFLRLLLSITKDFTHPSPPFLRVPWEANMFYPLKQAYLESSWQPQIQGLSSALLHSYSSTLTTVTRSAIWYVHMYSCSGRNPTNSASLYSLCSQQDSLLKYFSNLNYRLNRLKIQGFF